MGFDEGHPGRNRSRAIVVGSGPAGLLAALALRETFRQVCVIHRGASPVAAPLSRRDPGRAVSNDAALLLLAPGSEALEDLSPGAVDDLLEAGAVSFEAGAGFRWRSRGLEAGGAPNGLETLSASRCLVRSVLARRLEKLGGVRWVSRAEVIGLDVAEGTQEVRGVFYRRLDGADEVQWRGSGLVVDSSGRSEAVEGWLRRSGFPLPPRCTWGSVRVGLRSVCRWPGGLGEPRHTWLVEDGAVSASLQPVEEGRWVATISRPAHLPAAASSVVKELASVCETLGAPKEVLLPPPRWRREQDSTPGRFLAFGDARISFDPVFGMGWTLAARSARRLAHHLRQDPSLAHLRRWQRKMRPELRRAWWVQRWRRRLSGVKGAPFADPFPKGRWAQSRLLRVLNLVDSPSRLLAPGLWHGLLPARPTARSADRPVVGAATMG
ncbi:MAG: hypothetical protein AAF481_02785 [Acidobacteriota bacterium]